MTTTTDEHAGELKVPQTGPLRRALYCLAAFVAVFAVSFYFADSIFGFLVQPAHAVLIEHGMVSAGSEPVFTSLASVFSAYVTVALFAAIFICLPFFFDQFQTFWAAKRGRTDNLRKGARCVILAIPLFLGGALAYYFVFPAFAESWAVSQGPISGDMRFLLSDVYIEASLYLMMKMMLAAGLVFQLPVFLVLFVRAGKTGQFSSKRSDRDR